MVVAVTIAAVFAVTVIVGAAVCFVSACVRSSQISRREEGR